MGRVTGDQKEKRKEKKFSVQMSKYEWRRSEGGFSALAFGFSLSPGSGLPSRVHSEIR